MEQETEPMSPSPRLTTTPVSPKLLHAETPFALISVNATPLVLSIHAGFAQTNTPS